MPLLLSKQVHAVGPEQRGDPPDGEEAGLGRFDGKDPHRGVSPVCGAHRLPPLGNTSVRAALIG